MKKKTFGNLTRINKLTIIIGAKCKLKVPSFDYELSYAEQ